MIAGQTQTKTQKVFIGLSFLRDVCVTLITEISDWKKSIRDGRYIVMMIYLSELTRLPSTPPPEEVVTRPLSALTPSSSTVTAVPVRASSLSKGRGKRGREVNAMLMAS
jgi:hypothetical protein